MLFVLVLFVLVLFAFVLFAFVLTCVAVGAGGDTVVVFQAGLMLKPTKPSSITRDRPPVRLWVLESVLPTKPIVVSSSSWCSSPLFLFVLFLFVLFFVFQQGGAVDIDIVGAAVQAVQVPGETAAAAVQFEHRVTAIVGCCWGAVPRRLSGVFRHCFRDAVIDHIHHTANGAVAQSAG